MPAVSLDTSVTVSNNTSDSNDVSVAITPGGSELFMLLYVAATQAVTITAAFNGTSLTQLDTGGPTNGVKLVSFGLIAPSTGAHNIVISKSGNTKIVGIAQTFNNVNQTVATGTVATATGSNNAPDAVVTIGANDLAVAGVAWGASEASIVGNASQTAIANDQNGNTLVYTAYKSSNGDIGWTGTGGDTYFIFNYPILSSIAAVKGGTMSMMGI